MKKIFLPIDTKSLYYNIRNDNTKGHTCTVATPIRQGKSLNTKLNEVYKIPKQLSSLECDDFAEELNKNSKSINKITNIFIFDKIKVNGEVVDADYNYCFFIKEEVDPSKYQYGRTQLHYPISLKLNELNVNNKMILNKISEMYHNYAFLIEGFEYDFDDGYLDFKLLIVGYNNIPYTKVFINNKGAGNKFNEVSKNYIDIYDVEIDSLRRLYGDEITPENFIDRYALAEQVAKRVVVEKIEQLGGSDIRDISEIYPYSLFDLQYSKNGKIYYAIVYPTFSGVVYFNLSLYQSHFCHIFSNTDVFVVYNIGEENKMGIRVINSSEIDSLEESINSYRYVEV